MKLGMLHLFENPVGKTEREIVNEQIDLMVAAEELGFDSVWPAEHHFSEYGYCASPQVTLAAVATRTSKIRLGSGVVILPFHHPVRVAEDFAFLDLLSGGRMELGVGRGYSPLEYRGFNLDQTKSREMFDESIQIIKKCWTEDSVNFQGKYWQLNDIAVRPKPFQKPHIPIHLACSSPETFEVAGLNGYNLLMGFAFGLSFKAAKKGIESYREGRRKAGLDPDGGRKTCLMMVYPAKTMEKAREDFRGPVTWYYQTVAKYLAPPKGAVKGNEAMAKARDAALAFNYDEGVNSSGMVVGDVDHCVEKLSAVAQEFGFDELLCWTRIGGLSPGNVRSAMELLSGEILPRVRKQSGTRVKEPYLAQF